MPTAPMTIQQALDLAMQHHRAGRLREAEGIYRQILAAQPDHPDALHLLGVIAGQMGQCTIAIELIRRSIALKPNCPEAHSNLGNNLRHEGKTDEAIAAYRRALALKGDYPEAHNYLGLVLRDKGQLDEAIAEARQAISQRPAYAAAHADLGNALKDAGQLDAAIAEYRKTIALQPSFAEAHSNLVYSLHFHPDYDAEAIAREHRRWNTQHGEPLRALIRPHVNDRDPDRRLKIGYVSADFRDHVIGRNLVPLFAQHDRRQFEITCYSNVARPDGVTDVLKRATDHWRMIGGLAAEPVAQVVRDDRIDILVDLTLHMANSHLLLFARKPAPVQVTFAGYPGSTGLATIDYRLSDPYLDPPGGDESVYSEETVRLPDTFWCYDPLECRDIAVNDLPALKRGFVTFGCLNNFCKINDGVLTLWARVMREVAGSRLMLLSAEGEHRQRTRLFLREQGIDPERVEFSAFRPRRDYLSLYHDIDIGLDSFPYNGHTTSLESFWMGVPVVTLVGQTAVARAGWSQLSNLGLTELAGQTAEQFVSIAVELARDLPRLAQLRGTMRERMERSPLMDAAGFARGIEEAYRRMWRRWCAATT